MIGKGSNEMKEEIKGWMGRLGEKVGRMDEKRNRIEERPIKAFEDWGRFGEKK